MNNQTSSLEFSHFPVMLNEVIKISFPNKGGNLLIVLLEAGGYSKENFKFSKQGYLAIDRDKNVNSIAKELEKNFPKI